MDMNGGMTSVRLINKKLLYIFLSIFITSKVFANGDFKNFTDTIQYLAVEVNKSDFVVNNNNPNITLVNKTHTYVDVNEFLHVNNSITITTCISNITGEFVVTALDTITDAAITNAAISGFNSIESLIKGTLVQYHGFYDISFIAHMTPGINLTFVKGEGSIAVNTCWPINEGGTAGTVCVVVYPAKGPSDICTEPAESSASHIWHTDIKIFVTFVTLINVLLNVLR